MLYLNNIPASDVGVIVEHRPRRPVPRRESYAWDVPGRGRILRQLDAWENVTLQYDLAVLPLPGTSLEATVTLAVGWLNQGGYMRLWDDTDPLVYYLAAYHGGTDFENVLHRARRGRVNFDACPKRFLVSSNETVLVMSDMILNPTPFATNPRVTIYGYGSAIIYWGDKQFSAAAIDNGLVVDSESRTVTGPVSSIGGDWPVLMPGSNRIAWDGNVTSIYYEPRWFEI